MDPLFVVGVVGVVIAAVIYEIAQAAQGKPTISQQVWTFERLWPPVLFLVGVLCGHLFT